MLDKKLLIAAILLVMAVVAIAGCTSTQSTSTATPTAAAGGSESNATMPGGFTPGDMGNGTMPGGFNGTIPGGMGNGTFPGGMNGTMPGGMGNGTMPGGSIPGGMNGMTPGGNNGGSAPGSSSGGSSSSSVTLSGTYTIDRTTASQSDGTYASTTSDVSAVYVGNGGQLTLTNPTVTKTGDTTSEDNSNFYGLNAGVVAASGSTLTINGGTVTTNADGANGIFSTGTGTTVTVSGVTINTYKDSSRGLDVTQGATLIATDMTITTKGAHCASLAADRGGGDLVVNGGTMSTAGEGSPVIYCTGNFTITGITGTATGSEAADIEGKNTITLIDSSITGNVRRGVMIYQSTSGDATVGTGTFVMTGGALTTTAGPLFYVTNTEAVIKLYQATLTGTGTLLQAAADSWGTSGSNGGDVTFLADDETLTGNVVADNISTIAMTLQNGTTLTGTINGADTAKSISLTIDATSQWSVTGTSYLTTLADSDSSLSNIDDNGHTIYYDSSLSGNSWLGGKTITLADGGKLTPK